jgi:hypothetical protein
MKTLIKEKNRWPEFWYDYTDDYCVNFEKRVIWNKKAPDVLIPFDSITDEGMKTEIRELRKIVERERITNELIKTGKIR